MYHSSFLNNTVENYIILNQIVALCNKVCDNIFLFCIIRKND